MEFFREQLRKTYRCHEHSKGFHYWREILSQWVKERIAYKDATHLKFFRLWWCDKPLDLLTCVCLFFFCVNYKACFLYRDNSPLLHRQVVSITKKCTTSKVASNYHTIKDTSCTLTTLINSCHTCITFETAYKNNEIIMFVIFA